jgi:serine/threonine-protein kinase 24/25/MST4
MGPLEEASIAYVLRGVLRALAYLHGQARIHRDLKAANVLLSSSAAVKVRAAFRQARLLEQNMRLAGCAKPDAVPSQS